MRASRGLKGPVVVGLEELSVDSSVSVDGFDVRGDEGGPESTVRDSDSSSMSLPDMGIKGTNVGVRGRGLLGRLGESKGGVLRGEADKLLELEA